MLRTESTCDFGRRFEFPKELDMYKYTVDGLAAKEAADAAAVAAGSSPAAASVAGPQGGATPDAAAGAASPAVEPPGTPRPPQHGQQYQYTLKGIVVHSGTAFAGHYYSYIKVGRLLLVLMRCSSGHAL